MRIATITLAMLSVVSTLAVSKSLAQGQQPSRAVFTGQDAFVPLPPELIAAPLVEEVALSSNQRYILVKRSTMKITQQMLQKMPDLKTPPPGEISLVLWDSQARVSREVWKAPAPNTHVLYIAWIPQTDTALVQVMQTQVPDPKNPLAPPTTRHGLLRITPSMEKAQVVGLTDVSEEGNFSLWVSPTEPIAVLRHTSFARVQLTLPNGKTAEGLDPHDTLYPLTESGRLTTHVEIPKGLFYNAIQPTEDGGAAVMLSKFDAEKKANVPVWYSINMKTAALTPLAKAPATPQPVKVNPVLDSQLRVRQTAMTAKEADTTQQVGLLWLETDFKSNCQRMLISADVSNGNLLRPSNTVIYQSRGAAWAAPLLKLDKAQYIAMMEAAQRSVILSNAKQLGLAIIMYAQDYDETLPTGDGINSKLEPYLKNDTLFQGFSYTHAGGKLEDIKSPAETEMGYVTGPGGRAVIYTDGHVKWRKDE